MSNSTTEKRARPRSPSKPAALPVQMTAQPVAVVQPADPFMRMMQSAVERGASVEELDRLMGLYERHQANEAKNMFTAAMVEFKKNAPTITTNQVGEVKKDNKVAYTYGYADLAEVNDKIIAALAAVDISHDWTQRQGDGLLHVTCTLTHARGHSKSTTLAAAPDNSGGKNGVQAIGSTNTYLERYTLLAVTGLAVRDGSDDDGGKITQDERGELRNEAASMRQRHDPQQVANGRQPQSRPAPPQLMNDAGKAADGGRESFYAFWKALGGDKRNQLAPYLKELEQRALRADDSKAQGAQ